eukprot:gene9249-9415_t
MGSRTGADQYGADLTTRQFAVVIIALALGTLLEWYDFFSYSQLNSYLTKVFFPASSPAAQQLSFWGVYAVGFLARPIGSVLFGHIGDTKGRRTTLLISICVMAVPTVLIGCLPTYSQAGIAAPVLLAILRLIQGLAMGGEFGSALVYLHEIGPRSRQGFTGAIGFAAAMVGCLLGVLVVVIVEAIFNKDQMLLFGWRIPFLISIISASAALILRLHMPEPNEFVQERKAIIENAKARKAARQAALSISTGPNLSGKFSSLVSLQHGAAVSLADIERGFHQQSSVHMAADSFSKDGIHVTNDAEVSVPSDNPSEKGGEYVPLLHLLKTNFAGLLLQIVFEAWVSIGFYLISTWLPIQMRKTAGMSELLSQIMLMVNLLVMAGMQLLSGFVSDKGLPRLWSSIGVYVVAAGISVPYFMGINRGSVAGGWLLHALYMALLGWVLGIVPATCSSIYHASVRASGFNIAHNISMSWLGGVTPTVITALVAATGSDVLAPGITLTCAAVVSMLAAFVLLKYAPAANRSVDTDSTAQPAAAVNNKLPV